MYTPSAFREERPEVLRDLIQAHPLATIVTSGAQGLTANLIPFIMVETQQGDVLRAHMARANPQVAELSMAAEALVIFQGQEAYITPSWYATKEEHGKVVPTWNYVVVQAWGKPMIIDQPEWLRAQIDQMTSAQEAGRSQPWAVSDAPDAYITAQLQAIVGVEIPVSRIEGKWKVSQNQPERNRQGVADGLRSHGAGAMADLVENSGR
jgi:transcriptional regulator